MVTKEAVRGFAYGIGLALASVAVWFIQTR